MGTFVVFVTICAIAYFARSGPANGGKDEV